MNRQWKDARVSVQVAYVKFFENAGLCDCQKILANLSIDDCIGNFFRLRQHNEVVAVQFVFD